MLETTIVAVIDDDESILRSISRLINSAGYKVLAFDSAAKFLESQVETVSCVISDLRMPGINGLDLQEALVTRAPSSSILFITGHADVASSVSAMKAGAVDFLEKPVKREVLLPAIAWAISRSDQLKNSAAELAQFKSRYDRLTPRQREVFALVSAGLLNKQIAAHLDISVRTIKQHRGEVMREMEAESIAELVLMAERIGIRPKDTNFAAAKGRRS